MKPHVHVLVFEAWFTNAQSRIIGCYERPSNAPVLPPRSVIGSLFQGKICSWYPDCLAAQVKSRHGRMGKPRLKKVIRIVRHTFEMARTSEL